MDYKRMIIETVENIYDEWILKLIYRLIEDVLKEG